MWKWITLLLMVVYGGLVFLVKYNPSKVVSSLIYYHDRGDMRACRSFEKSMTLVKFRGTEMYYKNNGGNLVVHYHGSGVTACSRKYYADLLEKAWESYIFVRYSGYGDSTGVPPSRDSVLKDVENTVAFIKKLGHSSLIVSGASLGSGAASMHVSASNPKPEKVILMAPFSRLSDAMQKFAFLSPFYPIRELLASWGEEYDNIGFLQEYTGALFIIHGVEDSVVPFQSGKRLFIVSHASPKFLCAIRGSGHNDNLLRAEGVREKVIGFLKGNLRGHGCS